MTPNVGSYKSIWAADVAHNLVIQNATDAVNTSITIGDSAGFTLIYGCMEQLEICVQGKDKTRRNWLPDSHYITIWHIIHTIGPTLRGAS